MWMASESCSQSKFLCSCPTHTWCPLYSLGSDHWKTAERKLFNQGIAIYKKDFFLVQKLVSRGEQGVLWSLNKWPDGRVLA